MSRRPATITQAEIDRAIRAAKQQGIKVMEVSIGKDGAKIKFHLDSTEEPVNSWEDR